MLEEYKKGKRTFSDINMQFSDLTGANLEGITIENSKLNFVLLRHSNLRNTRFINCELFSCGFKSADLTGAVFDGCKIDYGYFDGSIFDNTKMLKCSLSFCALFSSGQPDTSTSSLFKVFTDASQISQNDLDAAFSGLLPFVENLGFEIKTQVQSLIKSATDKIGEPNKLQQTHYGQEKSYNKSLSMYQMMERLIMDYAAKNPYKTSTPYKEKKNKYKNNDL